MFINTVSGHLLHEPEQANASESHPEFSTFIFSTTTHTDRAQIKQDITEHDHHSVFSQVGKV